MNCPDDLVLSSYVDGELDPSEAEEVERHLSLCADCRRKCDDFRRADAAAKKLFEALKQSAPAPPIAARPVYRSNWKRFALAAAAVILIAAGVIYFVSRNVPRPPPVPSHNVAEIPPESPQPTAANDTRSLPLAELPDWLQPDLKQETYDEFVKRITHASRPAVDQLPAWQVDSMRRELLLARGIVPNGHS